MTYEEIINQNVQKYGWKAKYAYHYTDVKNAVNILLSGRLYSREKAIQKHLMINDNAGSSVISMTLHSVHKDVRFYFRPLTPTQYYNEGSKHQSLRLEGNINANVPVPVFFLFDLKSLLSYPNVTFTEKTRAGLNSSSTFQGIESFKNLPFEKIYSVGSYDRNVSGDLKIFRHAEIACPNEFPLKNHLHRIICRNKVERDTLINLIERKTLKLSEFLTSRVLCKDDDFFELNGFYIKNLSCDKIGNADHFSMSFVNSCNKKSYDDKQMRKLHISTLNPLNVRIVFIDELNKKRYFDTKIDYLNPKPININFINNPLKSGINYVCIYIENCLMACLKCIIN